MEHEVLIMGMPIWLFVLFIVLQVWIALMLSVQSAVLLQLLPEIKKTANNSDFFTKYLPGFRSKNTQLPTTEEDNIVFPKCQYRHDPMHIHNSLCK